MKKIIVVLVSVFALLSLFILTGCSEVYESQDGTGATIEILDDGGSVKVTTADDTVYEEYLSYQPLYLGYIAYLEDAEYTFRINGDVIQVFADTWSGNDPLGIAGYYKK